MRRASTRGSSQRARCGAPLSRLRSISRRSTPHSFTQPDGCRRSTAPPSLNDRLGQLHSKNWLVWGRRLCLLFRSRGILIRRMAEKVDCVVIGAGVVGLAVARSLAARGRETWVLEAEGAIGTGTSSRNSEVIHAGIYYPPGSAKAKLCVAGRRLLYDYCEARGVEHRRCGKLIVAVDQEQVQALDTIAVTARANGVDDVSRLTAAEAAALEPALNCAAALLSPSTGIVDSHGLMLALRGDLERAGGVIACNSRVKRGA